MHLINWWVYKNAPIRISFANRKCNTHRLESFVTQRSAVLAVVYTQARFAIRYTVKLLKIALMLKVFFYKEYVLTVVDNEINVSGVKQNNDIIMRMML